MDLVDAIEKTERETEEAIWQASFVPMEQEFISNLLGEHFHRRARLRNRILEFLPIPEDWGFSMWNEDNDAVAEMCGRLVGGKPDDELQI